MTKELVLEKLGQIEDPDLRRDIVSLGFVTDVDFNGNDLSVTIELTTPACPVKDQLKKQAEDLLATLDGIGKIDVKMTAQVRPSKSEAMAKRLPSVKNIITIASGKGGVGKSTVSANVALALQRTGAKVGLMDADIYGPSIPQIMGITELPKQEGNVIIPVTQYGIKVISMGFFLDPNQAALWRGPMLAKMLEQFIDGVEWGELDYLIIDLPPGTGDAQLTLCQTIPLTGSVIVSTPQDIAFNVARKAILMFNKLNSPILGFVENMSHFVCGKCGHREDIFGDMDSGKRANDEFGIPFLGGIPLATAVRKTADQGKPIVMADPEAAESIAFIRVAEQIAAQASIKNMETTEIKINF